MSKNALQKGSFLWKGVAVCFGSWRALRLCPTFLFCVCKPQQLSAPTQGVDERLMWTHTHLPHLSASAALPLPSFNSLKMEKGEGDRSLSPGSLSTSALSVSCSPPSSFQTATVSVCPSGLLFTPHFIFNSTNFLGSAPFHCGCASHSVIGWQQWETVTSISQTHIILKRLRLETKNGENMEYNQRICTKDTYHESNQSILHLQLCGDNLYLFRHDCPEHQSGAGGKNTIVGGPWCGTTEQPWPQPQLPSNIPFA